MNRQQEIVRVFLDGSAQDKLKIDLKEQGESVRIVVAYVGRGKDKLKLDYRVNHLAPETKSEIFVCGVLAGQAQKELNMTIDCRRGCVNAKGEEREDVLPPTIPEKPETPEPEDLLLCGCCVWFFA